MSNPGDNHDFLFIPTRLASLMAMLRDEIARREQMVVNLDIQVAATEKQIEQSNRIVEDLQSYVREYGEIRDITATRRLEMAQDTLFSQKRLLISLWTLKESTQHTLER